MAQVNKIRSRFSMMMRYRRTLTELRALPVSVKRDLDIDGIEAAVAHAAVYR